MRGDPTFHDDTCLGVAGWPPGVCSRMDLQSPNRHFLPPRGSWLRCAHRCLHRGATEVQAEAEALGLERVRHGGGRGQLVMGRSQAAALPSASPTTTALETRWVPRAQTLGPGGACRLTPALCRLRPAAGVAAEGLGSGAWRPGDQCPLSCVIPMRQEAHESGLVPTWRRRTCPCSPETTPVLTYKAQNIYFNVNISTKLKTIRIADSSKLQVTVDRTKH